MDIYNDVMLRRWSLDLATGRMECTDDAVDIGLISAADRGAIEARNTAVHAAIEAVEAFEADTSAEVAEEIAALARLRAGEASEDDQALIAATWGAPVEITLPTLEEIARKQMPPLTPRQIRLVMLMIGMTDADVAAKIDAIPDAGERAAAHIEWEWATMIKRSHALVESLRVAMDFDDAQFDALWVYGAAL